MAADLEKLMRFLLYEEVPEQGFDVKGLLEEAADYFRDLELPTSEAVLREVMVSKCYFRVTRNRPGGDLYQPVTPAAIDNLLQEARKQ